MDVEKIQDKLDTFDEDIPVVVRVSDGLRNITMPIADVYFENGVIVICSI